MGQKTTTKIRRQIIHNSKIEFPKSLEKSITQTQTKNGFVHHMERKSAIVVLSLQQYTGEILCVHTLVSSTLYFCEKVMLKTAIPHFLFLTVQGIKFH